MQNSLNLKNRNSLKSKKVMVAMSGGVDSSVAAYILLKSGYDVSGITMYFNFSGGGKAKRKIPGCQGFGQKHVKDAGKVCRKLGIMHHIYDLSSQMKENVVWPFINDYLSGKTPNPCIECNRFVKFGILFDIAMSLGFDFYATGHYASIKREGKQYYLSGSTDKIKDQSYFLYTIKKENLSRILFPLAGYTKEQVRNIAKEAKLPVTARKESQEICFIPDNDYKKFISSMPALTTKTMPKEDFSFYLNPNNGLKEELFLNIPGDITDVGGKIIGRHDGIAHFTIGQRKGIKISAQKPLYVLKIDAATNTVIVGDRHFLKKKRLLAGNINLLVENIFKQAKAKIRYNNRETGCSISILDNRAEIIFDSPQDAITPGQSIVFYNNGIVLGGGVIEKVYD